MSAITSTTYAAVPPRASLLVPRLVAVFVASVSLTLLAVGANGPYTHSNLVSGYDRAYTRTDQIVVGEVIPYAGVGDASSRRVADPTAKGARLFVTKGCAACHTLEARGGAVGPAIVGTDAATLAKRVRRGPGGMPAFSEADLTDADIAAIAAYLGSLAPSDTSK